MFRGVHKLSLDSKGRFAIPTRYRERLEQSCASQLVVTVDVDRCLLIYPLPTWEAIEQELMEQATYKPAVQGLQRLMVGHATEVEMDGQGRVLLSQELREFARMDRQVVLVGQGKKLELWDGARWAERTDQLLDDPEALKRQLAESLGTLAL